MAEYSKTKEAIQYYLRGALIVVAGLTTSALTYPLSVKVAKRMFGFKDFLNIHMVFIL